MFLAIGGASLGLAGCVVVVGALLALAAGAFLLLLVARSLGF